LTESPGRQRPTTETAAAACEGVIETPGALAEPGRFLLRPLRMADPSGSFRKRAIEEALNSGRRDRGVRQGARGEREGRGGEDNDPGCSELLFMLYKTAL